jgi:hypothetical protein
MGDSKAGMQARRAGNEKEMMGLAHWRHRRSHRRRYRSQFFMGEPLRRYAERQLNTHLKGYTVLLGRLDLHPLRFSVALDEVSIV